VASVFAVILGTGVGAGVVIGGRLLEGANRVAGEWGHNPLPWMTAEEHPGPRCWCGQRGCIETFLCGPALAADADGPGARDAGPLPARRDLLAGRVPLGAPRSTGPVGWVSGRCVLLRRTAWDSVDGYDPRHLGPVDAVDLGDRLARAGWLAVHVPAAEAAVAPGPVPGMLETARDGLRRYAADRHRGLARLT